VYQLDEKSKAIITTPVEAPVASMLIITQIRDRARSLVISEPGGMKSANDALGVVRDYEKEVRSLMDKRVQAADALHKGLVGDRKELLKISDEADSLITKAMGVYAAKVKEAARQEKLRIDKEYREAQEQRNLDDAAAIEAAGDKELANQIFNQPVITATPKVQPITLGAEGITAVTLYSAELTNLAELVSYIATGSVRPLAHPEQMAFLSAVMPELNREAKRQTTALNIPGVKLVCETSIRRRN